jgi:hypothetical protein
MWLLDRAAAMVAGGQEVTVDGQAGSSLGGESAMEVVDGEPGEKDIKGLVSGIWDVLHRR